MRLVSGHGSPPAKGIRNSESDGERAWPLDARLALFMLESACAEHAAQSNAPAPRSLDRFSCRVRARLWRIQDGAVERAEVFVRDLSAAHAGFVTDHPIEVGGTFVLDFAPEPGSPQRVSCVVGRCRPFMDDDRWHEGVLHIYETTAQHAPALERIAV